MIAKYLKMKSFPQVLYLGLFICVPFMTQAKVNYLETLTVNSEEFEIGNFLSWVTSSEINSQAFYVEKSINGVDFENVADIEAAGFSNKEITYRYMDIQVTDKTVYYRLRQADKDGTESITQMVRVEKKLTNNFMIADFSDIAVKDKFFVSINAFSAGEMLYTLKSYKGDVIFSTTRNMEEGLNEFEINLRNEKAGKYSVTFKVGDEEEKLNIFRAEDEFTNKPNVASKKGSNGG